MAFTGRLGTDESQPGNLQPGAEGSWSEDGAFQADAFQNDSFQVEEGGVERTATDSVTVSESVTRTGVFSRTTSDAPTTSDTATRSGTFTRDTTESITISDSVTATTTKSAAASDAVTVSESVERTGVFSRSATDAVTISETATRSLVVARTATDSVSVTDAASRDITGGEAQEYTFVLEAVIVDAAPSFTGSFGIDSYLVGAVGQHSRPDDHYGTQDDTTITLAETTGRFVAGTLLSEVLAALYTDAEGLEIAPNGRFSLNAFIANYFSINAAIRGEQANSFGIDARIAYGNSFSLDAVLKQSFGDFITLSAYIIDPA